MDLDTGSHFRTSLTSQCWLRTEVIWVCWTNQRKAHSWPWQQTFSFWSCTLYLQSKRLVYWIQNKRMRIKRTLHVEWWGWTQKWDWKHECINNSSILPAGIRHPSFPATRVLVTGMLYDEIRHMIYCPRGAVLCYLSRKCFKLQLYEIL